MERVSKVQGFVNSTTPRANLTTVVVLLSLLLAGCSTTTFEVRKSTIREVLLERSKAPITDVDRLNVRIQPFESAEIPNDNKMFKGISPKVRKAEGYFVANNLKNAMQQSGFWGAVRVVPKEVTGGDIVVSGRLLQSDGEILKLEVTALDSTGTRWLAREYEEVVSAAAYNSAAKGEVFLFLYNRIANDLAAVRAKTTAQAVGGIRQVSELKFAAELAPGVYGSYLNPDVQSKDSGSPISGLTKFFGGQSFNSAPPSPTGVVRLPAKDDPMMSRIRSLRTREETFVETLDLQYESLATQMNPAYTQWRIARLKEVNAVRKVEAQAADDKSKAMQRVIIGTVAGAIVGALAGRACGNSYGCASGVGSGIGAAVGAVVSDSMRVAISAGKQAESETEVNKAALEELGDSLGKDLEVTVVKTEGEAMELKGSADEKFKAWRDMLRKIQDRESGLIRTAVPVGN